MLRTAAAAIVAACTITVIGAPAVNAEPTKGTTTRSAHENAPMNVTVAAPRPESAATTHPRKGAHKAGHPVEDWRIARKRTMDRYFDSIRDKRLGQIQDWLDSLHH